MPAERSFITRNEAEPPFFAGIDLGGTNIKLGIVDDLGRPLSWRKIATDSEKGPNDGARRMGEALTEVAREAGLDRKEISALGLGSPGTMDIPAGMLLEPHNLPGWFYFPIRERVREETGLPVTFVNDANAAAFGEFWVGAGRDFRSMVLFTLGTGVGCGIVIGDLFIEGQHSHGAECGHIIVNSSPTARLCGCGQPGHLEAYASATGVIKRAEDALAEDQRSILHSWIADGEALTPILLGRAADEGDELAESLIMETARWLGIGAVTLANTIDPDGIVFGGAMTFGGHEHPLGKRFLARIHEEFRKRAFPVLAEAIKIDYASLGGDAGYLGAAGVARAAFRRTGNAET